MIDYEREKKEIETGIAKKEKEVSGQQSSLEDEQNQVAKLQKAIKEMQSRIEANEEELEAERQARSDIIYQLQTGLLVRSFGLLNHGVVQLI